jgi:hypothetical protein
MALLPAIWTSSDRWTRRTQSHNEQIQIWVANPKKSRICTTKEIQTEFFLALLISTKVFEILNVHDFIKLNRMLISINIYT